MFDWGDHLYHKDFLDYPLDEEVVLDHLFNLNDIEIINQLIYLLEKQKNLKQQIR